MLSSLKHYFLHFNVLILIVLFLNLPIPAQNKNAAPTNFPEPKFEHITIEDGLPENSVTCILQDHHGYLWFGTQNGLVKYDGYNMTVYQPDPDDSLSISHRQIQTIYEDKSGTLWIGTQRGLNRFDRITESFISFLHNPKDSMKVKSNWFSSICEDKAGNFWVGTPEGLNLFDRQNESFERVYYQDSENSAVLNYKVGAIIEDRLTGKFYVGSGNKILFYDAERKLLTQIYNNIGKENELGVIRSFYLAVDGTIWIGHSRGLAKFNSLHNTVKNYQPIQSYYFNKENNFNHLSEDNNGFIWGTSGIYLEASTELICFDPQQERFRRYKHDPKNKASLSGTRIYSLYTDNTGIIWVGAWGEGLNKWDRNMNQFKRFSYDPNNPDGGRFNRVHTMVEDSDGIIWFGTDRNGLYSFNRFSNEFHKYEFDTKDDIRTVNHIYKDGSGIIWFGTKTRGLVRIDPVNNAHYIYSYNPNDSTTISNNNVSFILPDENDNLWVGTWGGLNKFDKKTGTFIRYINDPNNPQSLSHNEVTCIYIDRTGILWIGTDEDGLNRFNQSDGSFESFDMEGVTFGTTINTIYEDLRGNFWIGTYHSGIHLFDRNKGISIYSITEKDGLVNNTAWSLLEDDSGNLWIGTVNGLSSFDPQTGSIKNHFTSDGFEGNRYLRSSSLKISTGEMLFGTDDGFIIFHPDNIKDDPIPPQVVISKVSLFNRPGEKLTFDGFISELDELDLSYDQRNATYTNLDAGEYFFRVISSNRDGVWNEEGASLKIIIPPPFWAEWWAYSLYVLFGLGFLYSIRRYELNRTLLKSQHKLDEVKLQEREETDKLKSRFFANISHEFRTPLTLILGPTEKILSKSDDDETQKQLSLVKRNANRLLGLINQLLDLSKLEAGKLELKASKANIVSFIIGITMSFESAAERKDIALKVIPEKEQIELFFDKEKMTKIMTNLLSNAFKFTPEGGEITVSVTSNHAEPALPAGRFISASSSSGEIPIPTDSGRNDTFKQKQKRVVVIKVRDSGVGISEEELPKLFDIFYQVDSSQTREHEGTGIGLALTKELVELHKGTISVNSKKGDPGLVGTGWAEFTIELPVGIEHLKDAEIVDFEESDVEDIIVDKEGFIPTAVEEVDETEVIGEDKNILLIVEDNADVREFIKDSLNEFQIEEAVNGEQGVRKAEKIIPDLIISDVMMPKMDGNELTRILKSDEKTSHIPIILLTAKAEQESKLEGLETGADDYLTKPFDTKELRIRIKNLINIRKKLQEKYSKGDYVPVKIEEKKKLSNLEEQFMFKVMEVIENHISEEEFSIDQFGIEIGMGSVQIYRKLKALTGKSPSLYIRSIRLVRAKKMIEEQKGNISEIAYSVGFGSPSYFTRCFKEEYGYPPSDLSG